MVLLLMLLLKYTRQTLRPHTHIATVVTAPSKAVVEAWIIDIVGTVLCIICRLGERGAVSACRSGCCCISRSTFIEGLLDAAPQTVMWRRKPAKNAKKKERLYIQYVKI